jgi:hypothetical protein
MSKKPAPDETLDILVRREGSYIIIEFIDAKCQCWGGRGECYSTGYMRLTPEETVRLAVLLLQAVADKKS